VADACRRHGLAFGVYLSPWDRNHPEYGRPGYVEFYRGQLRELLTNYGPLFEVWFDGANGGLGYYGGAHERRLIDRATYYGWPAIWALVRELQPGACIFSDAGPDLRWVGNECGEAGEPSWATLDPTGFAPGVADEGRLNEGDRHGTRWLPAECDVSIRPGWFYHATEDDRVKTPEQLLDLYFASVGRGASLLLNVPPDRRGRIAAPDAAALRAFGALLDRTFAHDLARDAAISASNTRGQSARYAASLIADGRRDTYWATDDTVTQAEIVLDLGRAETVGVISLREHIPLGQRIEAFAVDRWASGEWAELASGTSIGSRRLLRFPPVTTERLRVRILNAPVCPAIAEIGVFE
jgi:alpha-L-fucosidase